MRKHKLSFRLSPAFLGVVSLVFCLALTTIPPRLYVELVQEPDLMFGNIQVFVYAVVCVLSFLGGAWVCEVMMSRMASSGMQGLHLQVKPGFVVAVAAAGAVLGILAASQFISNPALYLQAVLTGSAESYRNSNTVEAESGSMALNAVPAGAAFLFYALGRSAQPTMSTRQRLFVYLAALIYAVCLIAALQRNLLFPFLVGMVVALSTFRWHPEGLGLWKLLRIAIISGAVVVLLFIAIGFVRSGEGATTPFEMLVGYVPGSMNRLAAVLDGSLVSPYPDTPYFSFRLFWHPPLLRRLVDMNEVATLFSLRIPTDAIDGWRQEFGQVEAANLNPMFIWPSVFGYAFYDFGWASPLYFFAIGLFATFTWRRFVRATAAGLVIYPYVAAAVLLWATDNFLSLTQFALLLAAALLVASLEKFNKKWTQRPRGVQAPS